MNVRYLFARFRFLHMLVLVAAVVQLSSLYKLPVFKDDALAAAVKCDMQLAMEVKERALRGRQRPTSDGRDVIVVTGGLHNIGRHLVERLQQDYLHIFANMTILVLDSSARTDPGTNLLAMGVVKSVMQRVDITNYHSLLSALAAYRGRIRGVVHLAAVSRVQDCHSNKLRCERVNVEGTKNILNALWTLSGRPAAATSSSMFSGRTILPWLVFASSREVYGELGPDDVVTETSPLHPFNVYGETKVQAENAIQRWVTKTGFNSVVLRFTNVYGSCYDHSSRLIPTLMSRLAANEPFDVIGSAEKTISLLHVHDATESLILSMTFADTLSSGAGYFEPFNIAGDPERNSLKMNDIVSMAQSAVFAVFPECKFCRHSAQSRVVGGKIKDRAPEPEHFRASIDKASDLLGYKPSKVFDVDSLTEYHNKCAARKQ